MHIARLSQSGLVLIVGVIAGSLAACGTDCLPVARPMVEPASVTLSVGQSFRPVARLPLCSDKDHIGTWNWTTTDTTVLRVDSRTGLSFGLRPGLASLNGVEQVYREQVSISVTVRPQNSDRAGRAGVD
jgi:hypothetical protein